MAWRPAPLAPPLTGIHFLFHILTIEPDQEKHGQPDYPQHPRKKHPLRNHAHDAPHMPRRSGTGTNSSHGAIHVVTKLIHVGRRQFVVQPDTNSTDQNLSIRPCLKQRRCRTHSLTEKNSGLQRKTSPTSRAIESVLAGPQPPGSSEPYPTYCASSRLASPSYPRSLHRLERLPSCIAPFHRRCHSSA